MQDRAARRRLVPNIDLAYSARKQNINLVSILLRKCDYIGFTRAIIGMRDRACRDGGNLFYVGLYSIVVMVITHAPS